jgi:hypothetical protein
MQPDTGIEFCLFKCKKIMKITEQYIGVKYCEPVLSITILVVMSIIIIIHNYIPNVCSEVFDIKSYSSPSNMMIFCFFVRIHQWLHASII